MKRTLKHLEKIKVRDWDWGPLDAKSAISMIAWDLADKAQLQKGEEVRIYVRLSIR